MCPAWAGRRQGQPHGGWGLGAGHPPRVAPGILRAGGSRVCVCVKTEGTLMGLWAGRLLCGGGLQAGYSEKGKVWREIVEVVSGWSFARFGSSVCNLCGGRRAFPASGGDLLPAYCEVLLGMARLPPVIPAGEGSGCSSDTSKFGRAVGRQKSQIS